MTQRFGSIGFISLTLLCFGLFQGCVTKGRFQAELSEKASLVKRLSDEEKQNVRLQKEKADLLNRIVTVTRQAGLREKAQKETIDTQSGQIAALSENRKTLLRREEALKTERQSLTQAMGPLKNELNDKNRQNTHLQNRLRALSEKSISLEETLAENERITRQKEREAQETSLMREKLIHSLQKEIEDGNVKISQMNDRLSVQIVDKILFPTGSNHVTGEGKAVLKKVGKTLKGIDKKIRIEGHTDNVPIGASLVGKFPTNWELSTARATQVVRYLVKESVSPKNLLAVGMSQYHPVASNDSPEGRQKNRRIEIILSPQ
ncbi:MAG: OmpA family protein [Nitrospiria bacterium]